MQSAHQPLRHCTLALALALASVFAAAASTNAENAKQAVIEQESVLAAAATEPATPVGRIVRLTTPVLETWPDQIEAHGDIMPWQETRISTEIGGLRLISVQASVGDTVKKGQVLALLNPASVEAELDAANAQLMETKATLAQAEATLARGKRLLPSGGLSQQELTLYETQKQTATARFNATQAQVRAQQLKLDSATLLAPDDGVISACSASEGAIVQTGSELFRLIRQGRLEWRAEVKGETLMKLAVGQQVTVNSPLGEEVEGRVRQLAPTIDLKTRTGVVYVALPADSDFKAGLTVSGSFEIKRKVLVLPTSSVLHGENGDQVFTLNAAHKIQAVKVKVGRAIDDRTEIISGINARSKVIVDGVESLKTGDTVTVQKVSEIPEITPDTAAKKSQS